MPLWAGDITPYDPAASVPSGGFSPATNTGSAGYGSSRPSYVLVGFDLLHGGVPMYMTLGEYMTRFDSQSRDDFLQLRNRFIAAGVLSPTSADADSVRTAATTLFNKVADAQANGQNITPGGFLNNLIRLQGLDPDSIGADANFGQIATAGGGAPTSYTNVSRTMYDISEDDARGALEQAAANLLGRDPTKDELEDFFNAARGAARKQPSVTTSTVSQNGSGGTTTSSRQRPGYNSTSLALDAEDAAKAAPDYASYQAVATYFPALLNMLGATTG